MSGIEIAALIPARNARHLLWRSLASLAGQTLPPSQALVLDAGSSDGLADWLRLRWPGIGLQPAEGDPGRALDAALAGVTAPVVAFLEPGDRWPAGHLEAIAAAWAESGPEALALPAICLSRGVDGRLRARPGSGEPPLSALAAATRLLRQATPTGPAASLEGEIRARLGAVAPLPGAEPALALAEPAADAGAATLEACSGLLGRAVAGLPAGARAVVIDLQATSRPAGLLSLLGMSLAVAGAGRRVQATTLADLTWPMLQAAPEGAAVIVTTPTALDLGHASDQLCIEEIVRRSAKRPVRLAVRSLLPSSTTLLSRLIETVLGHPDLELWVSDMVGWRYAVSLFGLARVRLTPPPLLALAPSLRQLGERQILTPAMLGAGPGATVPGLTARLESMALWPLGLDLDAARRLGPALARVLGLAPALEGAFLQQAWAMALLGWAAARAEPEPLRTADLDAALFAGACGRAATLAPADGKGRDVAATWAFALSTLGVGVSPAMAPAAA